MGGRSSIRATCGVRSCRGRLALEAGKVGNFASRYFTTIINIIKTRSTDLVTFFLLYGSRSSAILSPGFSSVPRNKKSIGGKMIVLLRPQVAAPRLAAWIVCILAVNSLAGCGGGSTNSSSPDPNPTPSLASSSVSSAITAGGGAFTLTVTGSNFVSSSVVQWNGTPRPTTFVSSSSLQGAISRRHF